MRRTFATDGPVGNVPQITTRGLEQHCANKVIPCETDGINEDAQVLACAPALDAVSNVRLLMFKVPRFFVMIQYVGQAFLC